MAPFPKTGLRGSVASRMRDAETRAREARRPGFLGGHPRRSMNPAIPKPMAAYSSVGCLVIPEAEDMAHGTSLVVPRQASRNTQPACHPARPNRALAASASAASAKLVRLLHQMAPIAAALAMPVSMPPRTRRMSGRCVRGFVPVRIMAPSLPANSPVMAAAMRTPNGSSTTDATLGLSRNENHMTPTPRIAAYRRVNSIYCLRRSSMPSTSVRSSMTPLCRVTDVPPAPMKYVTGTPTPPRSARMVAFGSK